MTRIHFVFIVALSAAGVAGLIYQALVGQPLADEPVISLTGTVLATFLVAALCWWLLVARPRRATPVRGLLTGLLISILSFPLAILITILISLARNGPNEAGLIENLLLAPVFAFGFSLLALATVGIITAPVGMLAGALLAALQARLTREP